MATIRLLQVRRNIAEHVYSILVFHPQAIKTFEEASQSLEPRQQKAQLQTILKAAHIFKDGKIELEFRGESS